MSGTDAARPAWSSQFAPEALRELERLPPVDDIAPGWAWGESTGAGVRVAVLDSGVDADHPQVGRVEGYVDVRGRDSIAHETSEHEDEFGHGTACAGIIRSLVPDCELYSIKVLGPLLMGRGAVFAAGLRWALDNGMHVCNLSLGTTKRTFFAVLHELADLAYFRNVMLVTAANNMPVPSFPSAYASVISVASHGEQDPSRFYYNPAPPVEFGALGIDVRVPWLNKGYVTVTGNSFAAPHLTGIVARILGRHPGLTVFQMKSILRALAGNMARETRKAET